MPGRKEEEVVISVGWYARIRPALAPMCGAPSYRDITVGSLLTNLAQALPARPALVYEDGPRYTFAELETEARLVARGLIALGVERGERVVVWATNVPEWIVLQFALAKIGAILVTANTSLRASDIDYLLRQSEAATLVTIRGFRDVDYVARWTRSGRPVARFRGSGDCSSSGAATKPATRIHPVRPASHRRVRYRRGHARRPRRRDRHRRRDQHAIHVGHDRLSQRA